MPDHVNVHDPDCAEFHGGDVTCADVNHKPDDDRPVTVADLLNQRDAAEADGDDSPKWDDLSALYDRADDDVKAPFSLIFLALEGDLPADRLSPDEQAEFDRRASGAGPDGR